MYVYFIYVYQFYILYIHILEKKTEAVELKNWIFFCLQLTLKLMSVICPEGMLPNIMFII